MSRRTRRFDIDQAAPAPPAPPTAPGSAPAPEEYASEPGQAHTVRPLFSDAMPQHPGSTAAISTDGDLTIAENATIQESLFVAGAIHIGARASVGADVTVLKGATLGPGVRIGGTLDVEGPLNWGTGAEANAVNVRGPIITDDGLTRATALVARKGIRYGASMGLPGGVSR